MTIEDDGEGSQKLKKYKGENFPTLRVSSACGS